jgi:hypothetical protein
MGSTSDDLSERQRRTSFLLDSFVCVTRAVGHSISRVVDVVQRMSLNEIIMQGNDGLKKLWDIDLPMENLSMGRRNVRFGWIQRPE